MDSEVILLAVVPILPRWFVAVGKILKAFVLHFRYLYNGCNTVPTSSIVQRIDEMIKGGKAQSTSKPTVSAQLNAIAKVAAV